MQLMFPINVGNDFNSFFNKILWWQTCSFNDGIEMCGNFDAIDVVYLHWKFVRWIIFFHCEESKKM